MGEASPKSDSRTWELPLRARTTSKDNRSRDPGSRGSFGRSTPGSPQPLEVPADWMADIAVEFRSVSRSGTARYSHLSVLYEVYGQLCAYMMRGRGPIVGFPVVNFLSVCRMGTKRYCAIFQLWRVSCIHVWGEPRTDPGPRASRVLVLPLHIAKPRTCQFRGALLP